MSWGLSKLLVVLVCLKSAAGPRGLSLPPPVRAPVGAPVLPATACAALHVH